MELEKIELPTKIKEIDNNLLFQNVMTNRIEEDLLKNLSFIATESNIFTLDCRSAGKDNILNFLSITKHLDRNAVKDGIGYNVVVFTEKWSAVYNGVDKDFILTRIINMMKEFNVPGAFIEDLKNII